MWNALPTYIKIVWMIIASDFLFIVFAFVAQLYSTIIIKQTEGSFNNTISTKILYIGSYKSIVEF